MFSGELASAPRELDQEARRRRDCQGYRLRTCPIHQRAWFDTHDMSMHMSIRMPVYKLMSVHKTVRLSIHISRHMPIHIFTTCVYTCLYTCLYSRALLAFDWFRSLFVYMSFAAANLAEILNELAALKQSQRCCPRTKPSSLNRRPWSLVPGSWSLVPGP